MNKAAVVARVLEGYSKHPTQEQGNFFAPANIALAKYWGKRNTELNLPVTSSLSLSLGGFGARTTLSFYDGAQDIIFINHKKAETNSVFVERLTHFLNLFRSEPTTRFQVKTEVNIPIGAGLASSACGFAAIVGALDQLYGWELPGSALSILARLGSGSASRSFWQGFVEWQLGSREDGMDSYGIPLNVEWPELRVGLLLVDSQPKMLSSRKAMERTTLTSPFYGAWPMKQALDFDRLVDALKTQSFTELGAASESNALAMHALMLTASPSILYSTHKTIEAIHKIWYYRREGLPLYFTQDAGPNLKLLFLEKDREAVHKIFPSLSVVAPLEEQVILVDEHNTILGIEEKMKAHQLGLLHRAFSVFVYRKNGDAIEFLLQQRHQDKYHCGGLWTNACCSHPRLGEAVVLAGQRRLKEEMSIQVSLIELGSFQYLARFDNGLTEHELDHVLVGEYKGFDQVILDEKEAQAFRWVSLKQLLKELSDHSEHYTPWFQPAFHLVLEGLCLNY